MNGIGFQITKVWIEALLLAELTERYDNCIGEFRNEHLWIFEKKNKFAPERHQNQQKAEILFNLKKVQKCKSYGA